MILAKVFPASAGIVRKEIKLPSGKTIVLGAKGSKFYYCSSKSELAFLSKQRDIQIMNPDIGDYIKFLETVPEAPTVTTVVKDPEQFDLSSVEEDMLKEELFKRGISIEKIPVDSNVSNVVQGISDHALVGEIIERMKVNPSLGDAIKVKEFVPKELTGLSYEELKQVISNLGYILMKKNKKKG